MLGHGVHRAIGDGGMISDRRRRRGSDLLLLVLQRFARLVEGGWSIKETIRFLVTTRAFGDAKDPKVRQRLRKYLPAEPRWLRQVHGTNVVDAGAPDGEPGADASIARGIADADAGRVKPISNALDALESKLRGKSVGQ